MLDHCHFILYVEDLRRSLEFYRTVLADAPILSDPGMVEFTLPGGSVLGLMPVAGINRLLGETLPCPVNGKGPPRAELYLVMTDADGTLDRTLKVGATLLSPLLPRDWGHRVAYVLDPDGHVLALAEKHRTGYAIEFV